ncbi:energy-coupling factor transporter transmembrane protein EcfT [Bifidobacterium amazonense]|uniref:Energy-coupling factor transporter transmembrane protein EcfT n=1 Tax=Bifidobacterium amazonense TaxID=2809027 RepID=A0ABS9VWV6_9BIFI|nr:energy-coupling factor transporter transmembrane component T [Bifidobacterium amazonense]MCH9276597.1 energy-coupling factor transporter transmembrane protein EcfT [Bifidobacterium amazonense]
MTNESSIRRSGSQQSDLRHAGAQRPAGTTLPAWLCETEHYRPLADRSSFIEHNLEHLGDVLAQIGDALPVSHSPLDRALAAVSPSLRIVGVLAVIVCVNLTRNMLFSYVMLAVALVALAVRPARLIAAILKPTLAVCAISLIVALPSVFVGQTSAPVRLVVRAFVAVSLVIALARTVPWNRLIGGLRGLGVPDSLVYVCDVTIQFIDILGRSMMQLLDALRLRSVGRDTRKLKSAGRLMGVLFLRANTQARHMAEAMVCRGFDGRYHVRRERWLTWPNAAYALGVTAMIAMAVYLG